MEQKQALAILTNLLKNDLLSPKEKEAIAVAIGILAWTSLSNNKIKKLKTKSIDQTT